MDIGPEGVPKQTIVEAEAKKTTPQEATPQEATAHGRQVSPRPDQGRETTSDPVGEHLISGSWLFGQKPLTVRELVALQGQAAPEGEDSALKEAKALERLAEEGKLRIDTELRPALKGIEIHLEDKTPDALQQWLRQGENHVFATLCFAVVELADPDSLKKEDARKYLKAAALANPAYCAAQIKCWMALQRLNDETPPDIKAAREIVESLQLAALFGIPIANWILGLADLGLVDRLPPGNPSESISHLWYAHHSMSVRPSKFSGVLQYSKDPLTFSFLEHLAKTDDTQPPDSHKLLRKTALNPDNHPLIKEKVLPWLYKVSAGVGCIEYELNQLSGVAHFYSSLNVLLQALHSAYYCHEAVWVEFDLRCNAQSEKITRTKQARQDLVDRGDLTQAELLAEEIDREEEALRKLYQNYTVSKERKTLLNSVRYIEILKDYMAKGQRQLPAQLSVLIHVYMAIDWQVGLREESHDAQLEAAREYRKAGKFTVFKEPLENAIRVFREKGFYVEAADASRMLAAAEDQFTADECKKYRQQAQDFEQMAEEVIELEFGEKEAAEFQRLAESLKKDSKPKKRKKTKSKGAGPVDSGQRVQGASPYKAPAKGKTPPEAVSQAARVVVPPADVETTMESVPEAVIDPEPVGDPEQLDISQDGSTKNRKKRRKKKKTEIETKTETKTEAAATPGAETEMLAVKPIVESQPPRASVVPASESQKPQVSGAVAAGLVLEGQQRKTGSSVSEEWYSVAKKDPNSLLFWNWHPEVWPAVSAAQYFERLGDIETEELILKNMLAKQPNCAGIERVHEAYAWYLYRQWDQPLSFLAVGHKQYKEAGKKLLNQALDHLWLALAIKVGVSVEHLPRNGGECQVLANNRAEVFVRMKDKEHYKTNVGNLMRSIGHMYDGLSSVVSRGGRASVASRREAAYQQKLTKQTRPKHRK
ncbi:MAG: hypothetical protein ACR2PT_14050 [Endozoicomonas sp.]